MKRKMYSLTVLLTFTAASVFAAADVSEHHFATKDFTTTSERESVVSDIVPPFEESFSSDVFTQTFTIIDANNDGITWTPYLGSAQVSYNSNLAMDDWLITPALALEGGKKYVLAIDLLTGSGSDKETFEVMYGNAPAVEALTATVIERQEVAHTKYETYSGIIAPAETGVYYVGIHGCSEADKYSISLRNLQIKEGAEASAPSAPTGLKVVTHTNGALKADVSLFSPEVNLDGDALESVECVSVRRDGVLVHVFESPVPGEELKFTDEVESCNRYTYSATATAGGLESAAVETTAFVGVLEPAVPAEVSIADAETPGFVTIGWEAPAADIRGNELDPQYISYRIYEGGSSSPLVSGLTETTYTLKVLDDISIQRFVRYEIVAETSGGISDFAGTEYFPVGTPYAAPFRESFAGGAAPSHIMENAADSSAKWGVFADESEISSQDEDGGFGGSSGYYINDAATWHTGKISLEQIEEPTLSFYVFAMYDGWEDDQSRLTVDVRCDGVSEPLTEVFIAGFGPESEETWVKVECSLGAYKDKVIRLKFNSFHDTMPYIFIDNINIFDKRTSGIGDVPEATAENGDSVEYYNLQGIRISAPVDGQFYIRRQGSKVTRMFKRR